MLFRSSYTSLELVLLPHRGLGFSLFESFQLSLFIFSIFILFATIQPKIPKTLASFIVLFIILANQYLQLLVGSTTFSNRKVLQLISCTWESSAGHQPSCHTRAFWSHRDNGRELAYMAYCVFANCPFNFYLL